MTRAAVTVVIPTRNRARLMKATLGSVLAQRAVDLEPRAVALAALETAAAHLHLDRPLLYERVDLIRDWNGDPRVLELEIAEPSLSLPLAEHGARRFAEVLTKLAKIEQDA